MFNQHVLQLLERVDALAIVNHGPWIDKNFFYFTQLRSGKYEHSAVIVTRDDMTVVTSRLEYETATREFTRGDVVKYDMYIEFLRTLAGVLQDYRIIGINFMGISLGAFNQLKHLLDAQPNPHAIEDVSTELQRARMIKTPEEIKKIREACRITTKVANEIPQYPRDDEKTVAAHVEFNLRKYGADAIAYPTISAFGPNAADPHYVTGTRKANEGEFLLLDFGAQHSRYNADVTRTFIFGRSDRKAREMYEVVLQAQLEALDFLRSSVVARDVDAIARNIIDKHFPGRFIHNLGHGLGLDVHDGGLLGKESDLVLEENMVFTVEPGVYIPGYGGVRIEDDVVIKKDGIEVLTPARKDELIEIPLNNDFRQQ